MFVSKRQRSLVFATAAVVVPLATGCAGSDPSARPRGATGGTGGAGSSKSSGGSGSSGATGSSGTSRATGSSGSTGAASPSIKVTCEWRRDSHRSDQADCECRSEGGVGDKFEVSGGCSAQPDDPTISCADPDFPHSGSCFYWELYPWRCENSTGSAICDCSFTSFDPSQSTLYCDDQAPGYSALTCCLSEQTCTCGYGSAACKVGEQTVSDCASADALKLPAPPSSCPAGQVQVPSCNVPTTGAAKSGTTPTQDTISGPADDCPGNCNIDDFSACCPVRESDGTCGTYCCDSSGCY